MPSQDSGEVRQIQERDSDLVTTGERWVGVPAREGLLTQRLADAAGKLFPPGSGRSSWLVLEPQTGLGIPDVLIIQASALAVSTHVARGLRLPTLSAARVLSARPNEATGVTPRYAQSLRLNATRDGWTASAVRAASSVVSDSLAIEVKLADAKRALQQLSKFRVSTHRAAICRPASTAHRASRQTLDRFGAGLLVAEEFDIHWENRARFQEIPTFRRLWLAELLVRSLEAGSAYRLSASRKRSIADASDLTRPS